MEFLSLQEIISMENEIKKEMTQLLSNKAVVSKPNSFQWEFFQDCVNRLFNINHQSKFHSLPNPQKAQLKFEAEEKLRKFYLRPGRKVDFVFRMIHKKELRSIFFDEADVYPEIGEYTVLIRNTSRENIG